jgi:curved DNA-binding protein CbpA
MQDEPKNYYDILEITPEAKAEEIRRAYIKLARKYHPDHNENNNAAIMAELNHIYEVLSNPKKRQEYDKRFIPVKIYDFSKPKEDDNKVTLKRHAIYKPNGSGFISRYWKEVLAIIVVLLMIYAIVYLIIKMIGLSAKIPA